MPKAQRNFAYLVPEKVDLAEIAAEGILGSHTVEEQRSGNLAHLCKGIAEAAVKAVNTKAED